MVIRFLIIPLPYDYRFFEINHSPYREILPKYIYMVVVSAAGSHSELSSFSGNTSKHTCRIVYVFLGVLIIHGLVGWDANGVSIYVSLKDNQCSIVIIVTCAYVLME